MIKRIGRITLLWVLGLVLAAPSEAGQKPEVDLDAAKAACEKGKPKGCYDAGFFLIKKSRGEKDRDRLVAEAKPWLAKACELREPLACREMGKLALAKRDLGEAQDWYERQCKLGKRQQSPGCDAVKWIEECKRGNQVSCKMIEPG